LASHAKVVHRSAQREGGPPALRVSFGRGSRLRSRLPTNELRMASQPSRRLSTVAAFSVSPEPRRWTSEPTAFFRKPDRNCSCRFSSPFFGSPRFLRDSTGTLRAYRTAWLSKSGSCTSFEIGPCRGATTQA
jgi:hypothetical protein